MGVLVRLNPFRDNPYWGIGVGLIVANLIPGLVVWALVASLIGEGRLEGDDADLTWLGSILVFIGPILGLGFILVGRPLARVILIDSFVFPAIAIVTGLLATVVGALTVTDTSRGANIGAGLLVMFGPFLVVGGVAWLAAILFARRQRQSQPVT